MKINNLTTLCFCNIHQSQNDTLSFKSIYYYIRICCQVIKQFINRCGTTGFTTLICKSTLFSDVETKLISYHVWNFSLQTVLHCFIQTKSLGLNMGALLPGKVVSRIRCSSSEDKTSAVCSV